MAARPIAIPAGGAPTEYKLPDGEALAPQAISARFDGTGAGAAFRPVVSFYAQSGELLARTFPDDAIAAGASSEVTFAPF